ncbi:MAG: hypothetical protein J4F46_10465 [Dehalococcoidia bacterium]|nr:hypothetical protein [Dehalococcoidia bacterium]
MKPQDRLTEWRLGKFHSMQREEVLEEYTSRAKAEECESLFAQAHGCEVAPNTDGPENATWYMYHFFHQGT